MGKTPLTDKQRDDVAKLIDLGMYENDIARIIGVSNASVHYIRTANQLVKEDKWEELTQSDVFRKSQVTIDWALRKYGKELPKPEPVVEKPNIDDWRLPRPTLKIPMPAIPISLKDDVKDAIKTAVTEAIEENCKCNIEQIDKDQMGRLMFALGNIAGILEKLYDSLDTLTRSVL